METIQNVQKFNNKVHYLCHVSSRVLVYPHQTESTYNSYGSFYLLGESVESSYYFKVYEDGKTFDLKLIIDELNPNFYVVKHKVFGDFLFHFENVAHWELEVKHKNIKGQKAIKRLRPWNQQKFETVCKDNNFYFVGFADLPETEETK